MAIGSGNNSKPLSAQNSDHGGSTRQIEHTKEDVAILNKFLLLVRQKFTATAASSPSSDLGDGQRRLERIDEMYKSPAYSAEKKILAQMNNNGVMKGLAVGIGTFAFLRAGPGLLTRFFQRKQFSKSSGGYKFDNTNTSHMTGSRANNPEVEVRRPGFIFRSIRFSLDCFVSLSMATYGSMYFLDRKRMMDAAGGIPLVEGRSLISDELCDDFTNVYRSIPQKTWEKYDGKSVPLDTVSNFVKNCIKRKVIETQILEERHEFGNLDTGEHVEIPSPGVPADTQVEIGWDNYDTNVKRNDEWDSQSDSMLNFDDSSALASFPVSEDTEPNFNDSDFIDGSKGIGGNEDNNDERRWS